MVERNYETVPKQKNKYLALSMDHDSFILSLYALRSLNADCRQLIFNTVPFKIWTRCDGCGHVLIVRDGLGNLYISDDAKYSFEFCYMCYNICQS